MFLPRDDLALIPRLLAIASSLRGVTPTRDAASVVEMSFMATGTIPTISGQKNQKTGGPEGSSGPTPRRLLQKASQEIWLAIRLEAAAAGLTTVSTALFIFPALVVSIDTPSTPGNWSAR